ncbi:hypothetical protein [Rhodoblastus sp.]|uniref:hypothetical protein n=1 Tax=Rhodoblastus sp. TaxID=1962975 RepID=UPI0025F43B51|nr:hypothetical protein [Rhodoblastus sp.]
MNVAKLLHAYDNERRTRATIPSESKHSEMLRIAAYCCVLMRFDAFCFTHTGASRMQRPFRVSLFAKLALMPRNGFTGLNRNYRFLL